MLYQNLIRNHVIYFSVCFLSYNTSNRSNTGNKILQNCHKKERRKEASKQSHLQGCANFSARSSSLRFGPSSITLLSSEFEAVVSPTFTESSSTLTGTGLRQYLSELLNTQFGDVRSVDGQTQRLRSHAQNTQASIWALLHALQFFFFFFFSLSL